MSEPTPVRVFRTQDLQPADPTSGMQRERAFEVPLLWSGRVTMAPGAVSGWHHHASNDSMLYVVSGVLRLEFDGWDEFTSTPRPAFRPRAVVHRAPRSNPLQVRRRRDRPGGRRPPTVNVEAPPGR